MTTEKLLEELKRQLKDIQTTISAIEGIQAVFNHEVKARKIIKDLKNRKKSYNGAHWMQQPKNRKKMLKQVAKMQKSNPRNKGE